MKRYILLTFILLLMFSTPMSGKGGVKLTVINITPSDNLQTAINNCNNPSSTNVYDIILSEGTYNVMNLITRSYVNIKGATTERSKYHIKGERPNGSTNCGAYETITFRTNTTLENLTITCKNMRYPVHNDACVPAARQFIKNCRIEHLGNWVADGSRYATYAESGWTSSHAHGCGTNPGMKVEIENSTLIGRQSGGTLYAHNNVNFSTPSKIICRNSIITHADGGPAVFMVSLGSNQQDTCELYNNTINGAIMVEDQPWLGSAKPNHSEWLITGSGNSFDDFFFNSIQGGSDFSYRYTGENYKLVTNNSGAIIPKGAVCAYEGTGTVRLMTASDTSNTFAGIAVNDIANGAQGYVQYVDKLPEVDVFRASESLAIGDRLGIDPGNPGRLLKGTGNTFLTYTDDWLWYRNYLNYDGSKPSAVAPKIFTISPKPTDKSNPLPYTPKPMDQVEKPHVRQKQTDGAIKAYNLQPVDQNKHKYRYKHVDGTVYGIED